VQARKKRGSLIFDSIQDVFMSVSLDTYDAKTGIHPRNKQLNAKRLSIAAMNIAYGQTAYSTNGPFLKSVEFTDDGDFLNWAP